MKDFVHFSSYASLLKVKTSKLKFFLINNVLGFSLQVKFCHDLVGVNASSTDTFLKFRFLLTVSAKYSEI